MLLTSPAVALLRQSLPSAHLSYLVGPWSAEAARGGPGVDSLRTLAFPGFVRPGFARPASRNLLGPYALLVREAARLRREQYDAAIVFRPDHWWGALLTLVAGIPVRVGARTPETTPLLTHARGVPPGEHAALQSLELARVALHAFGAPAAEARHELRFRVSDADAATARRFWERHALVDKRVVAIQPGAGAPLKSWPADRWARVADGLVERANAVLLVGGPDDAGLVAAIQAHMQHAPAATTCGQALGVTAALFQRCARVVGLDAGGAHLAAAVGTPTVRLYGPAPPQSFGPWPPRQAGQRVLVPNGLACAPCGHLSSPPCGATSLPACMLVFGVDDVLNAIGSREGRD